MLLYYKQMFACKRKQSNKMQNTKEKITSNMKFELQLLATKPKRVCVLPVSKSIALMHICTSSAEYL